MYSGSCCSANACNVLFLRNGGCILDSNASGLCDAGGTVDSDLWRLRRPDTGEARSLALPSEIYFSLYDLRVGLIL